MKTREIACFISPHGFGHATRTAAVLEALSNLIPGLHPHIFTTVPKALLAQTLSSFTYHSVLVDIGLVQTTTLDADIDATIDRLDNLLPYSRSLLDDLASICHNCSFVLCDIAPLGIAVARRIGIPSILLENFTWDWIYQPYLKKHPALGKHAQLLGYEFDQADYRIQTAPLCRTSPRDLLCGPIFRQARGALTDIRNQLKCGSKKVILITMGGIPLELPVWKDLAEHSDLFFIVSGQKTTEHIGKNILYLNRHTNLYHSDLIRVADLVVCKAGYSTVAECCQAGSRVISVGRTNFPESEVLQTYVENQLGGTPIEADTFLSGKWLSLIPEILSTPPPSPAPKNGADDVAAFLATFLGYPLNDFQ